MWDLLGKRKTFSFKIFVINCYTKPKNTKTPQFFLTVIKQKTVRKCLHFAILGEKEQKCFIFIIFNCHTKFFKLLYNEILTEMFALSLHVKILYQHRRKFNNIICFRIISNCFTKVYNCYKTQILQIYIIWIFTSKSKWF